MVNRQIAATTSDNRSTMTRGSPCVRQLRGLIVRHHTLGRGLVIPRQQVRSGVRYQEARRGGTSPDSAPHPAQPPCRASSTPGMSSTVRRREEKLLQTQVEPKTHPPDSKRIKYYVPIPGTINSSTLQHEWTKTFGSGTGMPTDPHNTHP